MEAQRAVNNAFWKLHATTRPFRTDGEATTRIGIIERRGTWGYFDTVQVHVSDHRQGRGQSVPIQEANANDLDVRVFSSRGYVVVEHVQADALYDTIVQALDEVR